MPRLHRRHCPSARKKQPLFLPLIARGALTDLQFSCSFPLRQSMALTIESLKKTYVAPDGSSVPVIDIASLRLDDGEQVSLIGTSGSGKTTLLHMIAGILAPDRG